MKIDPEDISAIAAEVVRKLDIPALAAEIARLIRDEGLTYSGALAADPMSVIERGRRIRDEHERQLQEKRTKRAAKKALEAE